MQISPHTKNNILLMPFTLRGEEGAKTKRLIEQFPGFWKWENRNAVVRIVGVNLKHILEHWPEAEWLGGTHQHRDEFLQTRQKNEELTQAKVDPNYIPDDSGYKYKRAPMDHQRKGFALSRDLPAFALLMEQGTGKTKVTIDTGCYLFQNKKIDAMVIVAWPNGVHRNWVDYELPADMSVPYVADYWTPNHATLHRKEALDKLIKEPKKMRVMTFNIEAFVSEAAQNYLLRFLKAHRCLFVIDQSASIKNHAAGRTKFLLKAAHLAPYRRILDGQPVAEGAEELYSQFKFLDPMIIGHDTWTAFKAEFCKIGYFNEITGYVNLPELHRRIDGYCYRVLEKDCLDLPPRIYKLWPFDLTKDERRIFDELNKQDLAFFDNDESIKFLKERDKAKYRDGVEEFEEYEDVTGEKLEENRAMIKNLRLQQISSGWWPALEFRMIDKKLPSRMQALLLLLEQNKGAKALIFSRFRPDLELLQKVLGKAAVSYHGGIKENDRAVAKRRFMEDPTVLYFIGQHQTAGIGHTLTAAKHVIYYCNHPSLRLREESEKRAHRKGQEATLQIWDLMARATLDSKSIISLRSKKDLADEILRDPKSFFLCHEKD